MSFALQIESWPPELEVSDKANYENCNSVNVIPKQSACAAVARRAGEKAMKVVRLPAQCQPSCQGDQV